LTTLPTARVGQTDLHVPVIGLGTAPLGNFFADVSEAQAVEAVHYALKNGVNFIDTAPWYGYDVAERLRQALAGVPRDSYVLATKVGLMFTPEGQPVEDFTREGILRTLDFSFNKLKIDRFDILHIHAPGFKHYRTALDEAYPLLADLRSQGVIKAIGNGENVWEPLVDFARDAHFDCFLLAGRYTLLEQGALNALNVFREKNISIFGAGVYNTGILAKGSVDGAWYQYTAAPPEIVEKVRKLETICSRHDVPLNAAAVQFVKAHPAVTSLVIGAESAEQLAGSIKALNTPIPAAFWSDVREAGLVDTNAPIPKE
jgi:D-threo-aldose 1-dehydrogenase